ncbi:MAG TPA: LapA family protein [Rhodanobacteraceae bacterium]|nr:LapA family protein [Rhodanobacteraceae bacterium]
MRLALIIVVLVFVVFGAVFGALNAERITIDFYFWQPSVPKGAVLLAAVVIGWLLGGLVAWLARVPRLHRDLRETRRQLRAAQASPSPPSDARPHDA